LGSVFVPVTRREDVQYADQLIKCFSVIAEADSDVEIHTLLGEVDCPDEVKDAAIKLLPTDHRDRVACELDIEFPYQSYVGHDLEPAQGFRLYSTGESVDVNQIASLLGHLSKRFQITLIAQFGFWCDKDVPSGFGGCAIVAHPEEGVLTMSTNQFVHEQLKRLYPERYPISN